MKTSIVLAALLVLTIFSGQIVLAGDKPTQAANLNFASNQDGEIALAMQEYSRANTIFGDALKNFAGNRTERGYLRIGLGESMLWQGDFKKASKAFKKAQSDLGTTSGADRLLQARIYDDLAWLSQANGSLDKARQYCKQSIEIQKSESSTSPAALVVSLVHMGYLLNQSGLAAQAIKYLSESLPLQTEISGPQSIQVADIKERLASTYRKLGKADEASKFFNEALTIKLAPDALSKDYSPHEAGDNVTFSYLNGAPNCFRKLEQGRDFEIVAANGITVAAAISAEGSDLTKAAKVDIVVQNESNSSIQFLPRTPELTVLTPKVVVARLVDPDKLAQTVEKRGERKAAWIKFWGAGATETVTTTYVGRPPFWGYAPIYSSGAAPPVITRAGGITTVRSQIPDYQKRAQALAKAANVVERSKLGADNIRAQTLGPTTIPAGKTLTGSLHFDVQKVPTSVLRIPVGNATFQFRFPPQ